MRQLYGFQIIREIALIAALTGGAGIEGAVAAHPEGNDRAGGNRGRAGEIESAVRGRRKPERLAVDLDFEGSAQLRKMVRDEPLERNSGYRPVGAQPQA